MPQIGILCSESEQEEKIAQMVKLFLAQNGMNYSIHLLQGEEQGEWKKCFPWRKYTYLILAWKETEYAFALAERLWEEFPSLLIIYVAQNVGDIFEALGKPFFHIVRSYDMEQDLQAAFRKMLRFKVPLLDRIDFAGNGKKLVIRRREILYLESEHHCIHLHLLRGVQGKKEIVDVTDTLTQCEEKLDGMGFVRIHRSFLVNMYHIASLEKESVLLMNGERLYVSRHRMREVRSRFDSYIRHLDFM